MCIRDRDGTTTAFSRTSSSSLTLVNWPGSRISVSYTHLDVYKRQVLAYDPYPDGVFARETGIAYVSLDELYRRSDIITLHCPLTNETKHLVNETSIARMKRGVMIVNTGRGQLIQTEALIEALKSKQVGAAGLDVYEEEGDYFYEDRSDSIIDDDTVSYTHLDVYKRQR